MSSEVEVEAFTITRQKLGHTRIPNVDVCVCVYCVCECKYLCVSSVYCHGLCAAGSGCDSALEAVLAGNCSIHDQIRLLSCTPHIFGTFRNIGHMTL